VILTYHKVHPENKTIWWVTPDVFYRQMADLRSKKVVYLDDYNPTDENQVVITFDGVYKEVWKYAVPILKHFDYPFELFVIGSTIGKDNSFDTLEPQTEFADIETLKKMIAAGGRLEWHSWSHARLAGTKDITVFEKELTIPLELQALDSYGFKWYAYPHGERDSLYRSQVTSRFIGALACDDGNDNDRYDLNRLTVYNDTKLSKTTVSLIIPCYNYGHLAAEAIESALFQTYPPDEILFIDDASTDNSLEVARRYESQIRIVSNEKNLGVVENFRKAVQITKGDYIVFLGADNRFRSDYVEECKAILDANPEVGVVYTHFILFGNRASIEASRMGATPHPNAPEMFIYRFPENPDISIRERNYIHGSSMYRRIAYEQAGGYKQDNLPEDHSIFVRILAHGWKAKLWDATSLEYRQHSKDQINQLKMFEMENVYLRKEVASLREMKASIYNQLEEVTSRLTEKEREISTIHQSKVWRLSTNIIKLYNALFPVGSWRFSVVKGIVSFIVYPLSVAKKLQLQREEKLLQSSTLFDAQWYMKRYQDLDLTSLSPMKHYLLIGGFEGRDPSAFFSTKMYLDSYPDVKQLRINPLVHYLRFGQREGRVIYPSDLQ